MSRLELIKYARQQNDVVNVGESIIEIIWYPFEKPHTLMLFIYIIENVLITFSRIAKLQ